MTASRTHLTDTLIRKHLGKMEPGTPRIELTDDERPFIRVRISYKLAAFYWFGRNPTTGKVERHKVGVFGTGPDEISTEQARVAAGKLKERARGGVNVRKERAEKKQVAVAGVKTVRDLCNDYLQRQREDGHEPSKAMVKNYGRGLELFLGEYMDKPMDALDYETILSLIRARTATRRLATKYTGKTRKVGSAGQALISVKCLTRLCRVNRLPDVVEQVRIDKRMPKLGEGRQGRLGTLEAQDVYAWLMAYIADPNTSEANARCARMFVVAMLTGWRISTVAQLDWSHMDFAKGWTRVPPNKTRVVNQFVPLPSAMTALLKPLRPAGVKVSGLVFPDRNGKPSRLLQYFTDAMPKHYTPHDARKAYSMIVLQSGASDMLLKLLMTHINDVTLKHYVRTTPTEDQVRLLRPTVEAVTKFLTAKQGNRATIKELTKASKAREAKARQAQGEYVSIRRKQVRAERRAKFAA